MKKKLTYKDKFKFLHTNPDCIDLLNSQKNKKIKLFKYITENRLDEKFYINDLLEIFQLKRSYWDKYKNKVSEIENKDDELIEIIKKIFDDNLNQYGIRRIKQTLESEYSIFVNHKKIRRILNENNLWSNYSLKTKNKKL